MLEEKGVSLLGRSSRQIRSRKTDKIDPWFRRFLTEEYDGEDPLRKFGKYQFYSPDAFAGTKSLCKYFREDSCLDLITWRIAEEWCMKHFDFMNLSDINEDFEWICKEMNPVSNTGFPFASGYKGLPPLQYKRDFIAYENGKPLRQLWHEDYESLATESYLPWPYVVTPKNELRPAEKIADQNCRDYMACNIMTAMHGLALLGQCNEKFYDGWNKSWSFVGGSPFHGEWHGLYARLNKHPNAFECDESGYDSSLCREMIFSVERLYLRWLRRNGKPLTLKDKIRLRNFFDEMNYTYLWCPRGEWVRKNSGNPSGSPITIVLNTLILFMLLSYAWLKLRPHDGYDYIAFMANVEAALQGDDNTWTCSDEVVSWFNVESVSRIWSAIGITTKPEAVAGGKLSGAKFVSKHFHVTPFGLCVPVPDFEKTVCSMLWNSRGRQHVRWSLLKAYALRIESHWNIDLRRLFAKYIQWLKSDNIRMAMIRSEGKIGQLSYLDVESVYKTDRELTRIYLGMEMASIGQFKSAIKEVVELCLRLSLENDLSPFHEWLSGNEQRRKL